MSEETSTTAERTERRVAEQNARQQEWGARGAGTGRFRKDSNAAPAKVGPRPTDGRPGWDRQGRTRHPDEVAHHEQEAPAQAPDEEQGLDHEAHEVPKDALTNEAVEAEAPTGRTGGRSSRAEVAPEPRPTPPERGAEAG